MIFSITIPTPQNFRFDNQNSLHEYRRMLEAEIRKYVSNPQEIEKYVNSTLNELIKRSNKTTLDIIKERMPVYLKSILQALETTHDKKDLQNLEEIIEASLGMRDNPREDTVLLSYEQALKQTGKNLLARTFRSNGGCLQEYDHLMGKNGVFCNPTTLIGRNSRIKTISQVAGNDWTGQPSFLIPIDSSDHSTIAHLGFGAINSFSSTDAIGLAGIDVNDTQAEKIAKLHAFLHQHWSDNISSLQNAISNLKRRPQLKEPLELKEKTFVKPYGFSLAEKGIYNYLAHSLDKLAAMIEEAIQVNRVISDNPKFQVIRGETLFERDTATFQNATSRALAKNNVRQVLSRLQNTVGTEELNSIQNALEDYIDNGLRHNEMVSRVYPWEIAGIELGANQDIEIGAVADLIELCIERNHSLLELDTTGIMTPLFQDFMKNKLSLENPLWTAKELADQMQKKEIQAEYTQILCSVKQKLKTPVSMYRYEPVHGNLINLSKAIAHLLKEPSSKLLSEKNKLAAQYLKAIAPGLERCNLRYANHIEAHPVSHLRKRPVFIPRISFPDALKHYWQKKTATEHEVVIFELMAEKIINKPYVDDSRRLLRDSKNFTVFRPNHDTSHSIRKIAYMDFFITWLCQYPKFKLLFKSFTPEETAGLRLAIFLSRSGRTNELSSYEDPTIGQRSAYIFSLLARELGFNQQLVENLDDFLKKPISPNAELTAYKSTGFIGTKKTEKAALAKRLMDLVHDLDLVRCKSWSECITDRQVYNQEMTSENQPKIFLFNIIDGLKAIAADLDANEVENNLAPKALKFAKQACELTGTPVYYKGFSPAEKVSSYESELQDPNLKRLIKEEYGEISIKLIDLKGFCTEKPRLSYLLLKKLLSFATTQNTAHLLIAPPTQLQSGTLYLAVLSLFRQTTAGGGCGETLALMTDDRYCW